MTLRNSLRAKFTLALLAMSFIAIAVVGLTARQVMLRRFNRVVTDNALDGFVNQVTAYHDTYGSFEAARQVESFFEFRRSRFGIPMGGGAAGGPRAPLAGGRPGPGAPGGVLPGGAPGDRPGGPLGGRGGGPGAAGGGPAGGQPLVFGGPPPPFIVVDSVGTVLLNLAGMHPGDTFDMRHAQGARPILSGGKEVALAVPLARPALSAMEEEYLSAMRDAWLFSLLVGLAMAIPIGIVLGNRFAAPILELTGAIKGMHGGELRQTVGVHSEDELGELSTAFNAMSENLAEVYQELEESRNRLEEQAAFMEELSRRDVLTELLNRRAFDDHVDKLFKQASRYDHPLTLAMVDVDHFKNVNDTFSHATGDAVLREVAALIGGRVREIDVVARYGGEEFAIAFTGTELAGATMLAEELRTMVEGHDWPRIAPGLAVTLSIGLSDRGQADSFRDVLEAADVNLYHAKTNGRNRVHA